MAKDKFGQINTNKNDTGVNEGAASSEITRGASSQKKATVSKQEQEVRKDNLNTQGAKGAKALRINMAFSPSNHHFIKLMSTVTGLTMTQVVNNIIEQYRVDHEDLFKKANEVYAEFMGDNKQ